jgi:hypothetical protein
VFEGKRSRDHKRQHLEKVQRRYGVSPRRFTKYLHRPPLYH